MFSYMILAPNEMQAEPDDRKSAGLCLDSVKLDPELYRLGHTKARIHITKYSHQLVEKRGNNSRKSTATLKREISARK